MGWLRLQAVRGAVCSASLEQRIAPGRTLDARLARDVHQLRRARLPRARQPDGDHYHQLAVDPLHISAGRFIAHDHDFQNAIFPQ